jgi:MarR family transcriptional regulator, organic hydroperoxide resistance regulator
MGQNDELLKLDNQLCFTIYACSREITKLYRPFLERLGLTYPQYLVMLVLWEHQSCTVKELGDRLFLDSGTLTPLLKRLQEAGFVTRTRSLEDERKVEIRLTDKGNALKLQAGDVPEKMWGNICMSEEEFHKTLGHFKQLLAQVQEISNQD